MVGTAESAPLERRTRAADAAEDHERILRHRLPDELRARLDLAVEAGGELLGLLAGRGARDDVAEPARDAVALGIELGRELRGLVARPALDVHLPGRTAFREQLLLGRGSGRLVVPPLLFVEPMLDRPDVGLEPFGRELGLDDRSRALRFEAGRGVDEDLVPVVRDDELPTLERPNQLVRLGVELEAEPGEEPVRVLR